MEKAPAKGRIARLYESLFIFIAQSRLSKNDSDLREIHSVIVSTITIIPLMWVHVYLMAFHSTAPHVFYIGVLLSTLHMFSPLLFRFTRSSFVVINVMLSMSVSFIFIKALYNGGIQSLELIWLVAPPMLAGMAAGRKGAKLWAAISCLIFTFFIVCQFSGHTFTDRITPEGKQLAKFCLMFGWMALGSVLSFVFIILRESSDSSLKEQTEKVDSLFRVLFHDLANSLGRINIGHTIAKKDLSGPSCARGLQIASEAAESMFEITQNVRRMYAVSKGKADMDLTLYPLVESLEYVTKVFAEELEKKKIHLDWDSKKLEGLRVLVEPISFKNQVLGNIVSNAIKFSREESIIKIAAYPTNHQYFTVEIRDAGIGMPSPILNNLFDLNKKTSRPGTCGEFGTGFGMHIMKSFMEIYQGQIKVESVEDGSHEPSGTTFKLILKGEWA